MCDELDARVRLWFGQDCGPCQRRGIIRTCVDAKAYALTFDDGPSPVYVKHVDVV